MLDRRCPRHSGFEDEQSPCSPWLPPVLTWKEKLLYATSHPPTMALLWPMPLHPDLTPGQAPALEDAALRSGL